MDNEQARFDLAKQEISELQQSIRSHDSLLLQVKGWAVTVGLASAGFALTTREPAAAALGIYATGSFWILDAHRRSVQQRMIDRARTLEEVFDADDVAIALADPRARFRFARSVSSGDFSTRVLKVLRSGVRAGTWALYLALVLILVTVAIGAA